MQTLDRNIKIDFGAEMKRKHFTLLHFGCYFSLRAIKTIEKFRLDLLSSTEVHKSGFIENVNIGN